MMYEIVRNAPHKISTDILLFFLFQDDTQKKPTFIPSVLFDQVNASLDKQLVKALESEGFTGEKGQQVSFYTQGKIVPTKVLVVGLGKRQRFVLNDLRESAGKIAQQVKEKVTTLAVVLPTVIDASETDADITHLIVEGIALGTYEFGKYKKKKESEKTLGTVLLVLDGQPDLKLLKDAVNTAEMYAQATILARDLVNEQPSIATPTYLSGLAMDIAKSSPLITCKIFDKKQAEKMGMDAFLGIAKAAGEDVPPKFIFLSYTPVKKSAKRKLALVGKGITFDSGGINVKPGDHMNDMKMDMAGAAIVLGVFSVIAKVKPDFPVIGLIAATPNLISGTSLVPGDVVRAMNGKTIEVLNTDAEGRVTMADSLSLAVKEGATEILDFATLTGAALVALGDEVAAVFSNNRDLLNSVQSSAFAEGEKVWELPLQEEYKELNKSEVADIANIPNTRYGGTITAALFLQEFVDNTPWVHFDIAGPAFANKKYDLGPKGGTGFGVRTVLKLLTQGGNK
jgi:leucyl aminopeptidase